MKKVSFLLLAVFAMINIACNKTEVSEYKSSTDSFEEDLRSYISEQKSIMHGVKTRSSSAILSRADIATIAVKMDSVTMKFYNKYPKLINELPKVSEEQLEVLKENTDSLASFVQKNYSAEIVNLVKEDLGSDCFARLKPTAVPMISDVRHNRFVQANVEISREFKVLVTENADLTYKPLFQESNKRTDCYNRYKNKVDNCYSTMVRSLILASLGSSFTGPVAGGVLSLSILYIVSDYNQCLYNAAEFYNLCNGQK